jgi:hypothetical protein
MAKTTRQTAIFGVEDWKRLYQTYREADFQSYDFETLRKSFVDYLRLYYPETFNDYIESSEFIAILDVMAFMGQALAFRNDLNARENFLDTAERRDSVVRLANLVSYTPKRNQSAQGFLKVFSVTTTEDLTDFNGVNLSNVTINWNDPTNPNWFEQFTYITNAAMVDSQKFGRPGNSQTILGVRTDEYSLNLVPGFLPIVTYNNVIEGISMPFEAVSSTSQGRDYVYEPAPRPSGIFNVLYRNDQLGFGSDNTGYFFLFKQGVLQNQDFNLAEAIPNRTVNINIEGVNNEDYWLYKLDDVGSIESEWLYRESIYAAAVEQLTPEQRKIYSITSRANDQITLTFGDGVFAEVPVGIFRSYVRASNGLEYIINPEEMQSVLIPISYISRFGRLETITFNCGITTPVSNAQPRESIEEIKQRAPARYYTQNRMVNGEDYNNFPFTRYNNIIKSKAVARSATGTSRYIDLNDITGKYSSTNIFASDGVLYRENLLSSFDFDWVNRNDIVDVIVNSVEPLLSSRSMLQFYYANFPRPNLLILNLAWNQSTTQVNETTGFFYNTLNQAPQSIGSFSSNNTRYIERGALIKFVPPAGFFFDANNRLVAGTPVRADEKLEIWATTSAVVLDGTNSGLGNLDNGVGPVVLNSFVPSGALAQQVIPKFIDDLPPALEQSMLQQIELFRNFGLGYNNLTSTWYVITSTNLSNTSAFSLANAQNTQGVNLDASWLIEFVTNGESYSVISRGLDYVFASVIETRFFFDGNEKVYDTRTGKVIRDFVKVLKTNSRPDSNEPLPGDVQMEIIAQPVESDGYVDDYQVVVSYEDSDSDGVADNPDFFDEIVAPTVNPNTKLIFLKLTTDFDDTETYLPVASGIVNTAYATKDDIELVKREFVNGQIFYAYQAQEFFELRVETVNGVIQRTLLPRTDFISRVGRQDLYFQYRHNSPLTNVIDPGVTNIIDVYIVNQEYYTAYQNYIKDSTGTVAEPFPPSIDQLSTAYSGLNDYKMISDNMVLNSVVFKPLFGAKAAPELRAIIKVVRAPRTTASISEIKSQVIANINNYFTIDKWDFGDNFFFSELSAYLHEQLGSIISSVVLVPLNPLKSFGDLYEIRSAPNEIFVSAATVNDVEIIDALTQSSIRSQTSVSGLYPTAISQGTAGGSTTNDRIGSRVAPAPTSPSFNGGGPTPVYTPPSGGGGGGGGGGGY